MVLANIFLVLLQRLQEDYQIGKVSQINTALAGGDIKKNCVPITRLFW